MRGELRIMTASRGNRLVTCAAAELLRHLTTQTAHDSAAPGVPWRRKLLSVLRRFALVATTCPEPRPRATPVPTRRLASCTTCKDGTAPELARESKSGELPPTEDVTFYEILDHALFGPELPVNAFAGHYPVSIAPRPESLLDGRPGVSS